MRKNRIKYLKKLSLDSLHSSATNNPEFSDSESLVTAEESIGKYSVDKEEDSADEGEVSRFSRIKEQNRIDSEDSNIESAEYDNTKYTKLEDEKDKESEVDEEKLDKIEADESEKEYEYSFEIKEGKIVKDEETFYTMLNNLVSTIGPTRYPFAASLQEIASQIKTYEQRSYSKINDIINFVEKNSEVNVPVNRLIGDDSKYIFNNYQGFKDIFYGNIDYLKGNKVDAKISGDNAVYVFGIQINTFSSFYNDYKKVASAFVSGSEAIRKKFGKSSSEKVNSSNIKSFLENLYILKSLFKNLNNSSVDYSSNFRQPRFPSKGNVKKIDNKEKSTKSKTEVKSEKGSSSNVYIEGFVFDKSFGLIQKDGNSYVVDHETVSSRGDGFNFTLKLNSDAKGVGKDEVEKQLISKNLLVFSDMLSAEESRGLSESDNFRIYVTLITMEYLKVFKDIESDQISFKLTQPFAYLLEQGYDKENYESSPFIKIRDESTGSNVIINANKEKTYIEKIAESVSQTKYKVKVDGKNKNMSVAQIYMARQSGKKVKVLGMYSLSEDVKKWNPGSSKK